MPAPWSRLLSYENASEHLMIKLDDSRKSTEKIENYNDLQIDKVSVYGKHSKSEIRNVKLNTVLSLSPVEFKRLKFADALAENPNKSSKTKPNVGYFASSCNNILQ